MKNIIAPRLLASLLLAVAPLAGLAQAADPYGSAKFASYPDIDTLKQIRTVWDFDFSDPKAVGGVFNNIGALMRAVAQYGPNESEPLRIVIVSHGPEVVVWARKNYGPYSEIKEASS